MVYIDSIGHMVTDGGIEELHLFAKRLGLRKEWFQDHSKHPHYDLTTANKRKQAVLMGAELVAPKEIVRISKGVK